jgi:hypothetical protein
MSKALTIRQPWAALVVSGRKRVEWRTWATTHRGPLLIHAGQGRADVRVPRDVRALASVRGALIGRVDVVSCEACHCGCGTYAWVLANARELPHVPMRGHQGLWDAPESSDVSLAGRIVQRA